MKTDTISINQAYQSASNLVTPLILTYNEEVNIERTLQKLSWALQIIIIDSYSIDKTLEIIGSYPQATVIQRHFDSFANQCNFGLSKINSQWVLSLDADYLLSDILIREIGSLILQNQVDAYRFPLKYCVFGQPLRGTLLPPRTILYRKDKACYRNDGHAHKVEISGHCEYVDLPIYHDDRKPLSRWLWSQDRYLSIEAQKLTETSWSNLDWGDRIRTLKVLAPSIIFIYCLTVKGGIFDGWRGWYYAMQRALAEFLLAIRLIEHELNKDEI